jgi:MFS family permease
MMKLGLKSSDTGLPPTNWFGLVTGVLVLALPFLGPWWIGRVGTGAMEIALSPFDVNMSLVGQPVQSSLVSLFLLAAKITFVIAGIFMILASLLPKRWWSKRLFRFGVMKPFWSVLSLLIIFVVGALIFNYALPGLLSGAFSGAGAGNAVVQINMPYISGTAVSTIQIGNTATITAPITFSLTGIFWLAVATAILGIVARIYHRSLARPEKLMLRPTERKIIAVKPTK